jgi:acetoin utilization protein AcuB
MKIRDIMRSGAITILETDTLAAAQRMMTRARIRHLPVVSDGRLTGMLSERDVLVARAHADGEEPWWTLPVRRVMSAPAQTAGPEDSLTEVAGRLAAGKLGALPVVERGQLLGLVTVADVLEAEVRSAMEPIPVTLATASDAMTPFPIIVHPGMLLVDAVAIMRHRHVRHLPVVDEKQTIVGMLSDRDVRTAIGDPVMFVESRTQSTAQFHVYDVMAKPAVVVPFDVSLVELARRFADDRVGALPVVDRFGALIGIVSYVDALRVLTVR